MKDVRAKVVEFLVGNCEAYFGHYCEKRGIDEKDWGGIDAVEAVLFVAERLQGDNNWLLDKLAETED